ncbi:hypothetical protein ILYODFUR_015029 [Ilyodon furcidens]|uniref:Uncharacterized protein n=1 Tax=Ilyodon furcidens TaxID=33524 RepID=A0ABV0TLQ4_9TELE
MLHGLVFIVRDICVVFVLQGSLLLPPSPPCSLSDIITWSFSVITPLFLHILVILPYPPPSTSFISFSALTHSDMNPQMRTRFCFVFCKHINFLFLSLASALLKCSLSVTDTVEVGGGKLTEGKKERGGHKHDDKDVVGSEQT